MKLFLYEYISAGGLGPHISPSLRAEGWAMLTALAEDFVRIPDVQVHTLLARSNHETIGHLCRHVEVEAEGAAFQEMTAAADGVLVIAPEFDGILSERLRWVQGAGKMLLGSSPAAIDVTADKYTLALRFARRGIPMPPTFLLDKDGSTPPHCSFPAICKPRHGAGSQATFLVESARNVGSIFIQASAEMPGADFVLQPFLPGQPASVSFIVGPKQRLPLVPGAQRLSADGRYHYLGGRLPLAHEFGRRAVQLAQAALASVDGLAGWIGVDLILGAANDGSMDAVIEINPRPTTSYIGLRQLTGDNLAETLLRVALGDEAAPPRWRTGPVEFGVAGANTGR